MTDKLRSYGAAIKVIGNACKQDAGRWLNKFPPAIPTKKASHVVLQAHASDSTQPKGKAGIHNIWRVATKDDADKAFDLLIKIYEPK